MSRNLQSFSKLTEFAPLSPETDQPGVGLFLSKLFKFNKGGSLPESSNVAAPTVPSDILSSSTSDIPGNSGDWQKNENLVLSCGFAWGGADEPQLFPPLFQLGEAPPFRVNIADGRNLPNVLKRISNLVALKNTGLQSYKDTDFKQYWMPDSVSKECYECEEKFTTFRRRHHCRVCGQIFCSKCCNQEITGKIMGCTGDLRVCTYCCKVVLSYLQSVDMGADLSAELRSLQEDLQTKFGTATAPMTITSQGTSSSLGNSVTESQDGSVGRRKVSVGYQEDRFALGRAQGAGYLSVEERCQALQKSASLRALFEDLCRPSSGINLQTHRYRLRNYQGCFLGSELVDWLLSQSRAATRVQATAIGQALIEGGFLECITDHVFTDAYALYRPQTLLSPQQSGEESGLSSQDPLWVKQLPQQDSVGTDSESECQVSEREDSFSLPSSNSTFYLDLNVQENTVTLSRPRRDSEEEMTITQATENPPNPKAHNCCHTGISNEFLSGTLWLQNKESLPKTDQPVKDDEQQAYDRLSNAYKQHEASLLKQLLNREGLSQSWADVLQPLVHRVVETVQPDVKNNDDMDVRRYVQFKKVPGGSRSESCIINGIVCTKNIAHRAMATCLSNPRILLLGCAIVYQRIEGRLLSIEPVMMQEREYLRNVVARIEALHPQLVLVHRNVSRLAQELLLQLGITLVLNVKTTALERVARCTGADIVSSVDSHIGRPQLGTCRSFYLQVFNTEKGRRKTLMFFEGCSSPHLGCTVLLRGASNNELARLKKVAKLLVFARYSWRLELSFLMDEFACPPNPPKDAFFDEQSSPGLDSNDPAFDENVPDSKPKQVFISKMDSVDDEDFKKESSAPVNKVESEGLLVPKDAINIPISEKQLSVDSALRHPKLSEVGKQPAALCSICRGLRTTTRDSLGMVGKSRSEETRPTFRNESEPYKVDSSNLTVEQCVDEKLAKDSPRNLSVCLCKVHVGRISSKDKSPSEEKRMNVESVSDFSDPLHSYLQLDDEVFGSEHHSGSPMEQLSVAELPLSNRFRKALDDTILSFSPYLTFSVPYLETEAGRSCVLWKYFPHEIFWSAQFSPVTNSISSTSAANNTQDLESKLNIKLLPQHQFVSAKLTSTVDNKEVQAMLAHFRACGGRLPLVPSSCQDPPLPPKKADTPEQKESSWPDALDPSNHQRLAVLFCSYAHESSNAPAFCVNPWVVYMEFYGNNDIPLGNFLERYCFRLSYVCPSETCETPMMDHVRRFVHDNGCVHILLKELDQPIPGEGNDIHMWSWCSRCKTVSSVVPMSPDTWSLSFAKFLELRFHGYMYTRRGPENPCLHSLHHDHLLYFGYKNIVASFKYTSINPWEISLPPPLVSISYDPQQQGKVVEEIKKLTLKGYDVYSNILERLYSLGMEMEVGALVQQLQREEAHYESRIKEIQLKLTSPTLEAKKLEGKLAEKDVQQLMWHIEDAVVQVKRLIADIVMNWNARLQDLVAHSRKKDEKSRKSEGSKTYTQTSSLSIDCDELLQEVAVEATSPTSLEAQYNDLPSPTGVVAVPITGPLEGEDSFVINFSSQDPSSTTEQVSQETAEQPVTSKESRDELAPVVQIIVTEESGSPAPAVVQPSSPKTQLRQHSDSTDDGHEGKPAQKIVKTILSQLLPSAAGVTPIQSPLSPQEHHLAPGGYSVPVVVYETEPSSIIAYALSSQEYRRSLEELRTKRISASEQPTPSPVHKRKLGQSVGDKDSLSDSSQMGEGRRSGVLSFLRGSSTSGSNSNRAGVLDGVQYSTSGSTGDTGSVESEEPPTNSKNSKVQPSQHIEEDNDESLLPVPSLCHQKGDPDFQLFVFFSDASTNFFCRVYFVEQFAALRQAVLPVGDEGFVRSLARCVPWPARGGKSGSTFCKTKDDRFVLKEMSRLEMQLFLDFAHHYFSYIQHCHSSCHPTLLGKIVGVYRIKFRNANTTLASNLLVMENLFYSRTVTHKFDLKGSVRNRLVNPATEREGEIVLLDENLLKMTCDSPLYIYPHSKTVLMQAINSDTKFLASQSVMDYSLLVGLDQERKELVVGIIDYIRTYTWDKKLEAMVKYYGNLGGGQSKLPTVVSPELYRARFIAAMHRYFLPVPDRWAGLGKGLEC